MKTRILFATCLTFLLVLAGCDRPVKDQTTLGSHTLTILNSSGKPYGGTHGTHQDKVAGTKTHTFESANGRYKIKLVDDVLTINGDKYTLSKPGSEIRIVDDRVEINGVAQGKPGPAKAGGKPQATSENGIAPEDQPVATAWTPAHDRWPTDIDWKKVPANQSLEVSLYEYEATGPKLRHRASPNLSDWDHEGATFGNGLGNQGYAVQLDYKGTKSGKDYYELEITHPEGDGSGTMSRRLVYAGDAVEVFRDDKYRICIQPRSAALELDQGPNETEE